LLSRYRVAEGALGTDFGTEYAADVIRARGKGAWQVVVYAGADPRTGRERRIRRTVHGSKRAAQDVERQLVVEARAGNVDDPQMTVADALAAWLQHAAPDLAATTLYNYRRLIDQRINPELGSVRLAKLTPAMLDGYYGRLRGDLSPKTIRNIHAVLRRALKQVQRWGWIASNPAALASPPRIAATEIRPPARADVAAFLAKLTATDPELGTLVWLAAVTGARRGELCGLRWSDIDATRGTLLIERAVAQIGGAAIIKSTKTHQARRIALDCATLELLDRQRDRLVERAEALGVKFTDDLPVFPNEHFEHLHPDTISKRYRAAADAAGMPGRLHDLRHFAATQALAAGIPVRTVAGRLGHANPATTHNVYAHFLEASDQHAAEVLGALVAGS
jgi:integrase